MKSITVLPDLMYLALFLEFLGRVFLKFSTVIIIGNMIMISLIKTVKTVRMIVFSMKFKQME